MTNAERVEARIATLTADKRADLAADAARAHRTGSETEVIGVAENEVSVIIDDLAEAAKTVVVKADNLSALQLVDTDEAIDDLTIGYFLVEAAGRQLFDLCDRKTEDGDRRAILIAWLW